MIKFLRSGLVFSLVLSLLFNSVVVLAEGFTQGTLIQTPQGLTPIEEIKIGSEVYSCLNDLELCTINQVLHHGSHVIEDAIEIKIGNEFIITDKHQRFFSEEKQIWVPATDYFVRNIPEKVILYTLSIDTNIDSNKNFYISKKRLIAHNMVVMDPVTSFTVTTAVTAPILGPAAPALGTIVAGVMGVFSVIVAVSTIIEFTDTIAAATKQPIAKEPEPVKQEPVKVRGPSESKVWKDLEPYRGPIKQNGEGKSKRFYKWDYTHNDIEVYDRKGRHLGSMEPTTGELYKPEVQGRDIGKEL